MKDTINNHRKTNRCIDLLKVMHAVMLHLNFREQINISAKSLETM